MNITIFNNAARRGYELYIDKQEGSNLQVAHAISFSPADLYALTPPVAVLTEQECLHLMDTLWKAGIRPSNGEGSVGQLGSTERHLADMRALVAKYTKTVLPR